MAFLSQKLVKNPVVVSSLVLIVGLGVSAQLSAHGGATGVVKERMDRMQTMKESMAVMGDMVKGKTPWVADEIQTQSQRIIEASKELPTTFPMGSMHGPSEALPAIWHDWDNFVSLAAGLDDQAAKLARIAVEGDRRAIKVQYVKLAKACRACHTDYRKKKDQG